jgi:hypothetical protein
MKKEALGIGIAAASFFVSVAAHAAATETQVFVTISAPKDSVAAFRKYLDEPSHRAGLEVCKETTNDAQSKKLNANFPRPLKAKEKRLFERLLFKCSSPGPEVFSALGAASREAALATAAPPDSIRVVLDTIASCDVAQCGSVDPAAGKTAAKASAVPCTPQQCYTGEVRSVNDPRACICRK